MAVCLDAESLVTVPKSLSAAHVDTKMQSLLEKLDFKRRGEGSEAVSDHARTPYRSDAGDAGANWPRTLRLLKFCRGIEAPL